mmetsp:Transcript_22642/g.35620  ORF Transcript_22642/g.35620 Transcript_22642/m.35620 type:complete len:122 (+) Transcript_22642:3-368(+)
MTEENISLQDHMADITAAKEIEGRNFQQELASVQDDNSVSLIASIPTGIPMLEGVNSTKLDVAATPTQSTPVEGSTEESNLDAAEDLITTSTTYAAVTAEMTSSGEQQTQKKNRKKKKGNH